MIYLTAGHNLKGGRGTGVFGVKEANGKQFDEASETILLVKAIAAHLKKWYKVTVLTDEPAWTLGFVVNWLKSKVKTTDLAIEFHFNSAAGSTSTGAETFVPNNATQTELRIALELTQEIAATLDIRNRGVKKANQSQHKSLAILEQPSAAVNLLVEVCFVNNPSDVAAYRNNYFRLVQALSDKLATYNDLHK